MYRRLVVVESDTIVHRPQRGYARISHRSLQRGLHGCHERQRAIGRPSVATGPPPTVPLRGRLKLERGRSSKSKNKPVDTLVDR